MKYRVYHPPLGAPGWLRGLRLSTQIIARFRRYKMRRSRAGLATASCLALCALTAACSSGGSSSGGSSSSVPGINGHTVEVGISGILSTPVAEVAANGDDGLIAYLKWINSQGGVNGYKFAWTSKDNANSSTQAAAVARQLAPSSFVIWEAGTEAELGVKPIAGDLKVPIIIDGDGDYLTPDPSQYMFGASPPYTLLINQMSKFMITNLGAKKIGLAIQTGLPGAQTVPSYAKSQGGEVVASVSVDPTTTNYTPYAEDLKASGAQAVVTLMEPTFLGPLQKAAAAIGYKPKWIGGFWLEDPSYRSIAGPSADGTYFAYYGVPQAGSSPSAVQYRQVVSKYYPAIVSSQSTTQGWDQAAVLVQAVKTATAGGKALTRQGFLAALDAMSGVQAGMVDVTYSAQQHYGTDSVGIFMVTPTTFTQVQPFADLSQFAG
jgi:branched-chain amino acid transport system substrate-binding protein